MTLIINTLPLTTVDRHTPRHPYTPPASQLPGERYTHWRKGPLSQLHLQGGRGVAVCVSGHGCVCVCLLKVLIKALEIELMEGIIKGLSAGPIASHSPKAGQRICPPLQHLPKGPLLTPLPLYSPLISFFLSSSSSPVYSPFVRLLTLTCPGRGNGRVVSLPCPLARKQSLVKDRQNHSLMVR